jgi:hypothetical protein
MISKANGSQRIETRYLDVKYTPTDWPFAAEPPPKPVKREKPVP